MACAWQSRITNIFCVKGSDYCGLVSKGGGVMEVQHHLRTSLLLVVLGCGEFTHLDLKHKGPLMFES